MYYAYKLLGNTKLKSVILSMVVFANDFEKNPTQINKGGLKKHYANSLFVTRDYPILMT